MQKVDLPTSFTKLNTNCGLPDIFTDYQIRHLGNPSGLPEILLKIDPCKLRKICRKTHALKAAGPDGYLSRVVKMCASQISGILLISSINL